MFHVGPLVKDRFREFSKEGRVQSWSISYFCQATSSIMAACKVHLCLEGESIQLPASPVVSVVTSTAGSSVALDCGPLSVRPIKVGRGGTPLKEVDKQHVQATEHEEKYEEKKQSHIQVIFWHSNLL